VTPRAHTGRPRKYLVSTKWMEPFQAQVDSLYLVLGEFQHQKDEASVGKAWMLTCVEGVNRPSFKQATREQRMYQQEGTAVRRKWRFLATIHPPEPRNLPGAKPTGDARATAEKMQDLPWSPSLCLKPREEGRSCLLGLSQRDTLPPGDCGKPASGPLGAVPE